MIELKIKDGDKNWVYPLGEIDKLTIGRAPTADIQITEQKASRIHCQIEMMPDGSHKLVDLESRNGTKVNHETVNTRILKPGDQIQIGQTMIQFGGAAAPVQIPAAPPAPKPASKPQSSRPSDRVARPELDLDEAGPNRPMGTIKLEKRPSHRLPVKKEARVPWELVVVGVGILAALFIGTMIYNSVTSAGEREQALKSALSVRDEIELQMRMDEKMGRMKDAIEKFEKIVRLYPDSKEAAAAGKELSSLRSKFESLTTWNQKYLAVMSARRDAGEKPTLDQLISWDARLAEIEERCPYGVIAAEARVERGDIMRLAGDAGARLIEVKRSELSVSLAAEDYSRVLLQWELFKDEYKKFAKVAGAADAEIAAVKEKAKASFEALSRRIDGMIDEGRLSEAQVLLEQARERYMGTEAHGQAVMKAQVVSLMAAGESNRGKAEEMVSAKKELYLSAADAETHARKRNFDKAIEMYNDIVLSTQDDEVKAEFSRRISELKSIKGLFDSFIATASSGSLRSKPWSMGAGTIVNITGADSEWVFFELADGRGKTQKRWREFGDDQLVQIFEISTGDVDQMLTIASFCFRQNMKEKGEEILARAYGQRPAAMDRITEILCRVRGVQEPQGGWVVYKNKWMTGAEKAIAEEDAEIAGLVAIVVGKPMNDVAGAVGKLSAMKRGRPELVKALHKRRETARDKLASGVRFDNQTLITLKAELDKRRAEALDFIEDEARYPDRKKMEAEGRLAEYMKIQKEQVDTRIASVREIWENPYAAAVNMNASAGQLLDDLKKINEWLAREDKTFDPSKAGEVDSEYLAKLANSKLNIQTFTTDNQEQKLIAFNLAVQEWNDKNTEATAEERAQVRITNEYRMMLGRRCVKIEDMLVRAARGHSKYMDSTGLFAHVIPNHPDGASPSERCAKQGYTGAIGENISRGHTDPMGSHIAWYNSSGHHRNMINRNWVVLGSGFAGRDWTQNFGGSDTTKGKAGSPSGGGWPGTDWRGGRAKKKD